MNPKRMIPAAGLALLLLPTGRAEDPAKGAPTGRERPVWRLDAFSLPIVGFQSDIHQDLPGAPDARAKIKMGTGLGARLGFDLPNGTNVGALYLFSHHRESRRRGMADLHVAFFEWEVPYVRYDWGQMRIENRLGLGGGFGHVGFNRAFDDETDLAAEIRASAVVTLKDALEISVGAGYFHFGHPGDTLGYGGFLSFGLGFRF